MTTRRRDGGARAERHNSHSGKAPGHGQGLNRTRLVWELTVLG